MTQLSPKIVLKTAGDQAHIPLKQLTVTLTWETKASLALAVFYKAKSGQAGGVFPGGPAGSPETFPFIQLDGDRGRANEQSLHIDNLDQMAELYLCAIDPVAAAQNRDVNFGQYDGHLFVGDNKGGSFGVPLAAPQSGTVAIIAKIDNTGFMAAQLVNENRTMDLATFRSTMPGADLFNISAPSQTRNEQRGMKDMEIYGLDYEFLYPGAFTMLKVRLKVGEMLKAEFDAMVAMSNTIDVEGKLEGGVMGGLGRMLAGEKFFFQTLTARRGPGEALLSHAIPGDIQAITMDGSTPYILQKDGFLAGSGSLDISTKMQNLVKGLFSGEGFFVIRVRGAGVLFVSSYGAIHPIDIPVGGEVIIDNSHLVAWPEGMNYNIEKASAGWISSMTSGEGLVCRFRGPGRVLIQTRNPGGFGRWIRKFIPTRSN